MKKLLLSILALALGCFQLNAQAPNLVFSNSYKGIGAANDVGKSIIDMPNGQVIVAGTAGNINPAPLNTNTLTSVDYFVGLFNEIGGNIWRSRFSGVVNKVAKDNSNNIYVVGSSTGTSVMIDGVFVGSVGTNTLGGSNIYVAKYTPAGILLWSKAVGSGGDEWGSNIAVDNNGDVYVTGYCSSGTGNVDFEVGNPSASFNISSKSFLIKLSTNGNYVWHKIISNAATSSYQAVCVDQNNVYWSTNTYGTGVTINTSPFVSINTISGGTDILVIKYRLDGTFVSGKNIGGTTANDYARGIEVKNNRIALFGSTVGTAINMNGYLASPTVSLSTNGTLQDGFLAVYDTNLVCQWTKPIGGAYNTDAVNGGTFDNVGNILIAGQYQGTGAQPCNFNIGSAGTFTAASNSTNTNDYFYAAYNVMLGSCTWLYHDGIFTNDDAANDITIDNDGRIWVTGYVNNFGTAQDMLLNKHFCASSYSVNLLQSNNSNTYTLSPSGADFSFSGCLNQNANFLAVATPSTNLKFTYYDINNNAINSDFLSTVITSTNVAGKGFKLMVKDSVTQCEQVFNFIFGTTQTPIALSISPSSSVVCNGSAVNLGGNQLWGGITYTWMPSGIVTPPNTYTFTDTPTATTTYTASVYDGAVCSWSATTTVVVAVVPTITAMSTSTLVCTGPTNTFTLSASGTATTFTWSSVNYGLIGYAASYNQGPVATNTFIVVGSNGTCTAQSSIVVVVSPCTGIDEQSNSSKISIYPNPAKDKLFIEVPSFSENTIVELIDVTGRVVFEHKLSAVSEQIDISRLNGGIYFLSIKNNGQVLTRKIIKE